MFPREVSVIGQAVGWAGVAVEPGSAKSGGGWEGSPCAILGRLPRFVPVTLQWAAAQKWGAIERPGFIGSKRFKIQNVGVELLLRAGLLVCTGLCNAACASGSYVGLWLLHSSPAVQELWGKLESKVTSKDTYFLLESFGPWACKKAWGRKWEREHISSTYENPLLNLQEFHEPDVKHSHLWKAKLHKVTTGYMLLKIKGINTQNPSLPKYLTITYSP